MAPESNRNEFRSVAEELEMARSAFAAACFLVSLLAMSGTALATPPCSSWVITDVVEIAPGERIVVGERCYERRQGFPVYYDAPSRSFRSLDRQVFLRIDASVTRFESSAIEALGAQSIDDLANPFPPGQGEADLRPE
jgi:hypothetical protein